MWLKVVRLALQAVERGMGLEQAIAPRLNLVQAAAGFLTVAGTRYGEGEKSKMRERDIEWGSNS